MARDCDRTALIQALADLAGRTISAPDIEAVLEHTVALSSQRANEIWSQHHRAPATVSLRDYLAMTLRFLDQTQPT